MFTVNGKNVVATFTFIVGNDEKVAFDFKVLGAKIDVAVVFTRTPEWKENKSGKRPLGNARWTASAEGRVDIVFENWWGMGSGTLPERIAEFENGTKIEMSVAHYPVGVDAQLVTMQFLTDATT